MQDGFFIGEKKMNILKSVKKKFKNFSLKKVTAIFTSICFIFSIISAQSVYAAMPISNVSVPTNLPTNTLIPFNLGRITDAYYSNSSGDIIINIQDLHSHEQTQRNISSILSILDKNFDLKDIYVEGASKTLNTKWLSDIQDAKTKQKVLDNLLMNGRLSGGELFAVQSKKDTILKGLEDKSLYTENFKKLNDIYNKGNEIRQYLSILNNLFDKKAEQYYSKENKKINKVVKNYKEGKIKTDKYIEFLLEKAQKTNINLSKYKSIISFAKVISKQKTFDQKKLNNEIKEILIQLKEKLNFAEYKTLAEKSTKKEFEVEFYFDLLKKAKDLGILSDKKYSNTNLFFEYLILNQNINTINLANDEKTFVQELNGKYTTTQAEKDIFFLKNQLESLSHYLTNKMTAKEHEEFSENSKKFKLLWEKYIDIDNLTDLTQYFNLADDFYNNNLERNRVFVKNLLGKTPNQATKGLRIRNSLINHKDKILDAIAKGRKIHVVITGGFHTYGFNKLLEEENVNYVVITPNITEETTKAEFLYENIFNEQYDITNTTFANRPVTEVIDMLNKGSIREIRPVGNGVEIEYISGEIISLNELRVEQQEPVETLSQQQAQLAADIVIDIQELNRLNRENIRALSENMAPVSTIEAKQKIRENLKKIENENLRNALEGTVEKDILGQALTNESVRNKIWYKFLTKLGLINIRESLVAISEQKDFDNIFMEEILGRIDDRQETAREKFLQEHEYYGEQEEVSIGLNNAVTSVIDAMNEAYEKVFGYFGIHSIAQLAAKIAGAKKHKEYNVNVYSLSKNIDSLLTKAEQKTYQVKFNVYFKINGMLVNYNTKDGDNNFLTTTAPTKAKAFNNAVRKAAEQILADCKLDRSQMNLAMFLIRQNLKERGITTDKLVTEVSREEVTVKKTVVSKKTNKPFVMRQPKRGEYKFNIIMPGINDTAELAAFQTVYAKSPRQAMFELIYQICMATEKGILAGGMFENLKFSQDNITTIAAAISDMYDDSKLPKIIKNVKADNAPVLNDNVVPQQIGQPKQGEKTYRVVIHDFNDRQGLEAYQYVYAADEKKAIEQAVLAIIKAKERNEIRGGYYNYRAVNRENKNDILESLEKNGTATVEEIVYKGLTSSESFGKIAKYIKKNMKSIRDLFSKDKDRGTTFSRTLDLGKGQTLLFDFSKTNIDDDMLKLFEELLKEAQFEQRRNSMLSGETYNLTEQRSVLHSALRNITTDKNGRIKAKAPIYVDGKDVMPDVVRVLNQMKGFSDKIISGQWKGVTGKTITDVVSIGIGGSDLGPRMATEALSTFRKGPNVHFVSNVDPNDIDSTLNALGLNPETTLFIIESKTFTTEETITNATLAKKWITDNLGTNPEVIAKHFVAVSTNKEKVSEFGIDTNNMFEFWNWVGGRFSVWSAVGLPLMCSVGFDNFIEFLSGANEIDENFKTDDITQNIPVLMAILNVLERNFLNRNAYAILPYNRYLKLFTSHIQQVYMESLGKSVDIQGNRITDYSTGSEIYGTAGTDAQHSYLQEHHQGTDIIPVDFIGFAQTSDTITDETMQESHKRLLANMLAQASAMAFGRTYEETVAKLMEEGLDEQAAREDAKAKIFDGNRPSTIMMFDKLTPRTLGALTALYEDMVATLGIIWNVNAFDQMGVQLGKVNAKETFKSLKGEDVKSDSSTSNMVNFILKTLASATVPTMAANTAANIISATKKAKTSIQEEQTNLQKLLSQLTDSPNDVELISAVEVMAKAGFNEKYIEKLLSQYLELRNGNIPQAIYSKTEQIKFGTAGVRGIMGEEVDFLDMVIITQAISNVISAIADKQNIEPKDVKILVGGDSRFLSKQFAEIVSKILAANDINVVISSDDIPSPTISYYTRAKGFTLSINITASHNPKEHNGYKITLGDGGQAGTDVTTMIENEIKSIQDQLAANTDPEINIVKESDKITSIDVKTTFIEAFKKMITGVFGIDTDVNLKNFRQKAKEWTIVVDPKNGATKKYYYEILKFFGFNIVMINDTVDPTFGGQKPEPSFENTKQLREKVKSITEDNLLGISTDVDGDRFAVVDKDGNFVTANEIGTILLNFRLQTLFDNLISEINAAQENKTRQNEILKKFLERKLIVPRNCATTHVLDDLADKLVSDYFDKLKAFNLDSELLEQFKNCVDVKEVNVGFKYFAQAKHDAENNGDLFLLGVESSGGISIAEWIYDKCGFLANIMLLFVLVENSKQPSDVLSEIYSDISYAPQGIETTIKFREIVANDSKFDTPEKISAEAKKKQENLMSTLLKIKQNANSDTIKNLFAGIDKGLVIQEIRTNDGIKIIFENGAWLLIRPSGTEPIVRIFDETKGDKELSSKLVGFVTENGGQTLIDAINNAIETQSKFLQANFELFEKTVLNSIKALQRLTYSVLFKDNMEYTIVANATDLARIKEAQLLSNSGIKVNLVLTGETSLIQETGSRISTADGDLAFCLMSNPNSNLTVYGYDDNSYGQTVNISNITEQDALIAMLQHINDNSQKTIKILDLPENLNRDIVTTDVEESAKGMFSTVGVGKAVLSLFTDALKAKKKQTDDMFIKPSLVASNLSAEQIDSFNQEDIDRLVSQGVTTIIVSADDKLLQDKSQTLKSLLQAAHDNGLKVMFNYTFDLNNMTTAELKNWISSFDNNFQPFKENGGIDGLQVDLSQSGVSANNSDVLSLLSELSEIVTEQNVGSFLSLKIPSNIYPNEFLIVCNNEGIKLVVDYDSPLISVGLSNLKTENMIINISADKNGFISIPKLSTIFENNKVSMLSFDSPILDAIDTSDGFSFNGLSITKFITSIFETTPEGQNMRGINKGRNFVINRESVINEDILQSLCTMYINDKIDVTQINAILATSFKENISKYELKGFVEGLLEASELKKINAADISFDKEEYSNLLMQTLLNYRIAKGTSFQESDINKDLEQALDINKFRAQYQPKIDEVYKILNGRFENKVDTVINTLSALSDNPELNSQERAMILEGLLLLLLGYAKQDIIDMGNLTSEESLENIKAILRAA